MPKVIFEDIKDVELFNWLVENQDKYDIKLTNKTIKTKENIIISEMIPESIRPNFLIKVDNTSTSDSDILKENETIDTEDTPIKTGPKYFPRDLGSFKVTGTIDKKCMGKSIDYMEDSTKLLSDPVALYNSYLANGYLYFKKLIDKSKILAAKKKVEENLKLMGHVSKEGKALSSSGWTVDTRDGTVINGTKDFADNLAPDLLAKWKNIGQSSKLDSIINSHEIKCILTKLNEGKSKSAEVNFKPLIFHPNYTWMRIKGPMEFTTEHADLFYFKNFTSMFSHPGCDREYTNDTDMTISIDDSEEDEDDDQIDQLTCVYCESSERESKILLCDECNEGYHMDSCLEVPLDKTPQGSWHCPSCAIQHILGTCWIPLDDIPVDQGVLAVLPGSQYLPNFESTYKDSQIPFSYFNKSSMANSLTWRTGPFDAGDVVIFDSKLIHCTSRNYSDKYRLSIDFRWYLAPIGRKNYGLTNHSKFVKLKSRELKETISKPKVTPNTDRILSPDNKIQKLSNKKRKMDITQPKISPSINSKKDQVLRDLAKHLKSFSCLLFDEIFSDQKSIDS